MEDTRRILRKKEKQSNILTAASKLFQQKGISAVSLEEIADVVGISRGTIYNHFHSKDDLVRALIEPFLSRHLSVLKEIQDMSSPITLRPILEICVKMWENHHGILNLIKHSEFARFPDLMKKHFEFHKIFKDVFKKLDLRPFKFDSHEQIAHVVFSVFHPLLNSLEKHPKPYETFYTCMEDLVYKEGYKPK